MPSLAGPHFLQFQTPPPDWLAEVGHLSASCASFLWNGLSHDTRRVYSSARTSYEDFCSNIMDVVPWPANENVLAEWLSLRARGSTTERALKPDTLQSYLSALRSVHVDRRLPTDVFQSEWLHRIITGIRRLTPHEFKVRAAPITLDILEKITSPEATTVDDLNLDTACKVAFAGFLRSGEFLHDDRLDRETFENTSLTRSDVTFAENDEYARIRLKRSKTDTLFKGVDILLAATGNKTCPVYALRQLFQLDPRPHNAPLFNLTHRSFTYSTFVPIIQERIRRAGILHPTSYKGHSFRRGAAQQASNNGLPEADIQALGRWTSQAFKAYFKTIDSQRYNLSARFLTGQSPSLSRRDL
jgi:hypothetical protein